jgi:competence ComEA-like helix-hairpin-helix protein
MALALIPLAAAALVLAGNTPPDPDDALADTELRNEWAAAPLDLNRASADDLARLPGITPRLAAAIVRNRLRNGVYRSIEDLLRVPGTDEAVMNAILPFVEIRWQDLWRPTGTIRVREERHAVWLRSGPLAAYAGPERQYAAFESRHLSVLIGDHRVSTGLGLVQHHGLRADPGAFTSHRHGFRMRGNASKSTNGDTGWAGRVRAGPFEAGVFAEGGRLQWNSRFASLAITTSAGAWSSDLNLIPESLPLSASGEVATYLGRRAMLADLRWTPRRRLRMSVRVLDVENGYAAPNALMPLRFGRRPAGERSLAVGVAVDGWTFALVEARSRNSALPDTDTDVRLGYDAGAWMADVRHRQSPNGGTRSGRFGLRLRESRTLQGEIVFEVRNAASGGRAVVEWRPRPGMRIWGHHAVFHADDYDDRLYAWEPEAHRTGRIRLLYGRGVRTAAYAEWSPASGVTLSLASGMTRYHDRWGPDAIRGETVVQMMIGF